MSEDRPGNGHDLVEDTETISPRTTTTGDLAPTAYETMFNTVEDAVFVFDVSHDGDEVTFTFRENNPAHESITGITTEEHRGHPPQDVLDEAQAAEVSANYRTCVKRRETIEYEETLEHPSGTVEWLTKLTPIVEDGEVMQIIGVSRDITDRKKRERELTHQRERLQALFDEAPDGVIVHDSDGEILDVNETICEQLSYTRQEMLSMDVFDIDVSLDEETIKTEWQSMDLGSMHRLEVEGRNRRKDGSTFPVEVWVSKVRSNGPESNRFVALIRDITERKEYERELQRRETKYRNLFEESRDALMLLDRDGFFDCNEAALELFDIDSVDAFTEYTPGELSPSTQPDGTDSETAAKNYIEQAFEEGSASFEWTHKRGDGSEFDAEVKLSRFKIGDEPALHEIIRNITDRKEREQELERYEEIVESASDALWMFRDDFSETLFMNQPYEEIFGQSRTVLQDDPLAFIEATHPDDRELMRQQVEQVSSGCAVDFELRVNPQEDFGRWVWIKGEPIYDEDDDQYAVSGFVRDITDIKEQQQQIRQFKAAIEQAAHAVYITDIDGNIEYANPAFEEITGYTEAEAMGETPSLLKSGEHDEQLYEELWETILDGRRWHNEMVDQRKDGEQIVLDQTISPLKNEDSEIEKFVAVAKDITERKERERELERHRTYLESTNDMITLIEPDGTIEYVSPAVERILGFKPEELIGENGFEYVHSEDRAERIEDIEELVESPGEETVLEYQFQCADGSYCWIESTARNLLDEPSVEGLLLSSRDITNRKEYEQRLSTLHDTTRRIIDAESKKDVAEITVDAAQALLEFSLPSVWYPAEDGTELTLVANSAEHQTLLEEAGTPTPTHSSDRWLWDVIEADETVIRSPIPTDDLAAEVPLQSAIVLPLGEHGIFACGAKGKTEFSDREIRITEILAQNVRTALDQLEQREALERQKEFTDDLLDAIEDVVYVLDTNGDFEQWNTALEEVTGYQHDEIESMNAADLFAEEDREAVEAAVEESFETGRTRVELNFLTAEGESIPYEFIAHTFENPTGEPVLAGIGRDRSAHVEYERRLEEQRDNLDVLNQVVRHDIRNDMTVVKGRANLLEEHVDDKGREDLDAVLESTENAIELTKTARDLSETMLSTEEDVELVRLDEYLGPPIENARSKFDDAIITVEDRIPEVTVRGNGLLEAVFRNLIQNAVVHNDKGAPRVQISTTVGDKTLTVAIADNGPGIPDDQKETIFGKGEKGLDSPGTGIGLYLVRTLVDQYGGDVWVEDNEPEGSVFYVELPQVEETVGQ